MAEKGLPALRIPATPKVTSSKITDQAKVTNQAKGREIQRNPPKQNPPKQNPPKQDPPLEPQVVVVPVDQAQDQNLPDP